MSRRSLPFVLAVLAAALAGFAVADQRVGLALTVALLAMVGAGVAGAQRPVSRVLLVLAVALAVQPVLRDAGWVVALDVLAFLAVAAAALASPVTWRALAWALAAPWRLVRGGVWVARTALQVLPWPSGGLTTAALRGIAAAAVLLAAFGALFVTADSAFAQLAGDVVSVQADPADLIWRLVLALAFLTGAGALVRASAGVAEGPARRAPWAPGATETRIALGALVALFALFVAVQLRVLFGGPDYVRATTGLGFGDYARQGFVVLLLVAALTLAVIGVAARRSGDRGVRGLLGALCVLTLIVLASALHRLDLVIDAYGLTAVRYTGGAVIVWLAALFALVLIAGASRPVLVRAPRIVVIGSAALALVFSLSNPEGRIAQRAVDRQAATGTIDASYVSGLSADAIPALRRLPQPLRRRVLAGPLRRLERPDGVAGFNVARWLAR
jgi:hypothetical protein